MVETAQGILLFVVLLLTILLVVLGIQVFFILKELRDTIQKANKVLDDTGSITESVSGPITSFSSIVSGVKTGAVIAELIKKSGIFSKKHSSKEEDGEE